MSETIVSIKEVFNDVTNPGDAETQKTFEALGDDIKQMYQQEAEKYKRDEQD